MTKAEDFVNKMMWAINMFADSFEATMKIEAGIVKVSFDDGSMADFTDPQAFDEKGFAQPQNRNK